MNELQKVFQYEGKSPNEIIQESEEWFIGKLMQEFIVCFETVSKEKLEEIKLFLDGFCKKLDTETVQRIDAKVTDKIEKYFENRKKKSTLKSINFYEKYLPSLFKGMSQMVLTEVYEASQCLDLNLTGGVYFLRNKKNGLLKIGCANNIFKRIKEIRAAFNHVGYDDKLSLEVAHMCFEPHIRLAERQFHLEFAQYRVINEWFNVSIEELQDFFFGEEQITYIENTIVSLGDCESVAYEPVVHDFAIDPSEAEYEFFGCKETPKNFFDILGSSMIKNKLYRTVEAVESSGKGVKCVHFSDGKLRQSGIKSAETEVMYTMNDLKLEKFNHLWFTKEIKKFERKEAHQ